MSPNHDENDDAFRTELRAALERKARLAPRTDLATKAMGRARRIRARRRAGGLVAACAAVAVAVPVGAAVVHQMRDAHTAMRPSEPLPVVVRLAGLRAGNPPQIPYLDQGSYVSDTKTQPVQPVQGATIQDVTRLSDGLLVWTKNRAGTVELSTNGAPSAITSKSQASNPVVDSENQATAWAVRGPSTRSGGPGPESIVYAKSLNDPPVQAPLGKLQVEHVIGARAGIVVFNATDGHRLVVARVNMAGGSTQPVQPWPGVEVLSAVDSNFTMMAGRTSDMTGTQQHCIAVMSYGDASPLWRSCAWRPVDFSADGSLVYAVATPGGAVDTHTSAVLDAKTGHVVREFTTKGTFGRASFEGDSSVDMVLVEHRRSAIIRCTVRGACERATHPLPVDRTKPGWLVYPYQLTANP